MRTVTMPWPPRPTTFADAIVEAVGPRTRLAIVDHIAAESALVLPLADIAARLRAKGVAVMADGAHAPGAIAFRIADLGVDWYVANLHKWMWVPRSSGILWATPERQRDRCTLPVISWGLDEDFATTFDLPGTRDPSAHLAAPTAVDLVSRVGPRGHPALHPWPRVAGGAARLTTVGHAVRDARVDDWHDGHCHLAGRPRIDPRGRAAAA